MKHGKKYVDALKTIDRQKLYDTEEAVALSSSNAKARFDDTIEAQIRL